MSQEPPAEEGGEPVEVKKSELVCTEARIWNRVLFGYARKWSRMPWVAFEEHLDREECERLFGDEVAGRIQYTTGEDEDEDETGRERLDEDDTGERKTALVYQIWDKDGGRKLRYLSPQYRDGFLLVQDDPLGLTGFFNVPRPLMFVEKTGDLVPVSLYTLYENQARELNRLTIRINRIVEAIKARGGYDSSLGTELGNVMKADDNELVPVEASSSLAAEKGFQNAIWFMPLDTLINVLDKLYLAREQCKQVIYEIIGIADIMRGASKASETLGAQQIKNQWGTLRIKPKQAEVQRYSRDLLRIMLEIAATKFSEDTWARMTGMPFTTQQQVMQAQAIIAAAQMSGMPPDPQAVQMMQAPSWQKVLGVLRDDMQRSYRIDIETNSTLEPEAAEDQKNIADLLTALGQYLNGVGPLVEKGVLPFGAAQAMMLAISRRFRFGTEIEDYIRAMKPPPPEQKDDGKTAAASAQLQAQQAIGAEKARTMQLEIQLRQQQAEKDMLAKKADLDLRELTLDTERKVFDLEKRAATESVQNKAQIENEKLTMKGQVAGLQKKQATVETSASQKASAALSSVTEGMQRLAETQAALLELLQATRAEAQELARLMSAPRVRTPVRGKDGRIERVVDEIQQPTQRMN